ncbi:MAG TPA: protein phosphatase 2C domain-containing protein [Mycobacteriales bacterium]|nr:protein phosphatase 2C domain-containing protein [Mycobacteriales bacterium]
MTLTLRFAALSHVGLVRGGNEDSAYAGPRILAVADGMGGHAAGEVASAVAIASLAQLDEDAPGADLLEALREQALSANAHLRDMVTGDPSLEGMGTTLTALLFAGQRLGVLHVGDSRCYLLRDGALTQITHDHTLVQSLVDEGRISEDEASTHPQRSLILRALDGREGVELDLSVREARAGDRYLLCTDGLTGPVGRIETLHEALEIDDPQAACERLVSLALRGGGPDNITVVVADVLADGPSAAPVVGGAAAETPQALPEGLEGGAASRARAAEQARAAARAADDETARLDPVDVDADADADADADPPRRRSRRGVLAGVLVLALLGLAALGGWAYLRTQYYVGVDADTVAVYRGVNTTVAGVPLASVDRRTDLPLERLGVVNRSRVERGIVAADREEAEAIVARLEDSALPECEPAGTGDAATVPALPLDPADPAPSAAEALPTSQPAPTQPLTGTPAPPAAEEPCADGAAP